MTYLGVFLLATFIVVQRRIEAALLAPLSAEQAELELRYRWRRIAIKAVFLAGSYVITVYSAWPFTYAIPALILAVILSSLRGVASGAFRREAIAFTHIGRRSPEVKILVMGRQAPFIVLMLLLMLTDVTSLIYNFSLQEITNPGEAAISYWAIIAVPILLLALVGYFVNRRFYQRTLARVRDLEAKFGSG